MRTRKQRQEGATQVPDSGCGRLFVAPDPNSLRIDDRDFGVAAPTGKGPKRARHEKSNGSNAGRVVDGVRIVSMDELQNMVTSNPKAGTTPLCPFDCDCCY